MLPSFGGSILKTLPLSSRAAFPALVSVQPYSRARAHPIETAFSDDLSRQVFGLLGVPVDAINFPQLLHLIEAKAPGDAGFLISTPNVNFMVKSQGNGAFRESLLRSSLCLVDGMPLIWIAKLLDIPVTERIAGADLFGRLKSSISSRRPLRVFLVGGTEGVAAKVGEMINASACGLRCVGALNPGFGSVPEISTPEVIDTINAAKPDIVAVFFAAEKAQAWLMHNADRLRAPIRAQFGATINFEAGLVKRAPRPIRSSGFEWLWRIKEEPYLWRRYANDGRVLLRLFLTSVLPLMLDRLRKRAGDIGLGSVLQDGSGHVTLHLAGDAVVDHVEGAIAQFRKALAYDKPVIIDMSGVRHVDSRFFGALLMLRKMLVDRGDQLAFTGISPAIRRLFKLNRFAYLLPQS